MIEEKKETIVDIYEDIKGRIVRRELLPDVKINQKQIADDLNVSRTPVIKALHMLKSEGLVDNLQNKGFYVHKPSLQETTELYELRQAVEMVAVVNTVENASQKDLEDLRTIFLPFLLNPIDPVEYAKADRIFHSRLIELSQNSILQRTNQSILILPKAFTTGLLRSPEATLQEHLDLIYSLLERNAQKAQAIAGNHLAITIKALKNVMFGMKRIGLDPQKITIADISLDNLHNQTPEAPNSFNPEGISKSQ
jgi:DNA-binding GntR family transcriptional regulator